MISTCLLIRWHRAFSDHVSFIALIELICGLHCYVLTYVLLRNLALLGGGSTRLVNRHRHLLKLVFHIVRRLILDVLEQLLVREFVVAHLVSSCVVADGPSLELSKLLDRCLACQLLLNLFQLALRHVLVLIKFPLKDALINFVTAVSVFGWDFTFTARLCNLFAHQSHGFVCSLHVIEARLLPVGDGLGVADDLVRVFVRPPLPDVSCDKLIDGGLTDV